MNFASKYQKIHPRGPVVFLLALALAVAFYRGFRLPNAWSENYYQVSMFDGIFRRSLLGTLLYPLGCQRFNYFVTAVIQWVVLLFAITMLVIHSFRQNVEFYLSVYFLSAAGAFVFHEVGYIEQFLYVLLALALFFISKRQYMAAAIIAVISILGSELAVMTTLPLMVVASFGVERRASLKCVGVLLGPPFAVFMLQSAFFQTVPLSTISKFMAIRTQCGFPVIRATYLDVFTNGYEARSHRYFSSAQLLFNVLPLIALSGVTGLYARWGRSGAFVIACACMAPLGLGFVGWDTNRWLFLSFTNAMLSLIVIRRYGSGGVALDPMALSPMLAMFFVVAFTLSLNYFDGFSPRPLTNQGIKNFMSYARNWTRVVPAQ